LGELGHDVMVIPQSETQPSGQARASWVRQLTEAIVDLLFPPRCAGCRKLGAWLCERCIRAIDVIQPPVCPRCGRAVAPDTEAGTSGGGCSIRCGLCSEPGPDLGAIRAYAYFSGTMREAIHELKYQGVTVLAAPLGQMMARAWTRLAPEGGADMDAIVPVPLHPARERERGYNQAALLARELGRLLGHPVVENVLRRSRATLPQVSLDTRARYANVQGAFRCTDDSLRHSRVLLIDDVCTTGATLEAAAAALRRGGASTVVAYTLARAK